MAYTSHFTILKGEYRDIQITVKQNGISIDLTNATLIDWILAKNERMPAIVTKSYPASGIDLTDPVVGIYNVVLNEEDTSSLDPGVYYQQSRYTINSKTIVSIAGTVRILPAVI